MSTRRDIMYAWLRGRYGRRMALVLSGQPNHPPEPERMSVFVCFWSTEPSVTGFDTDRRMTPQQLKAAVVAARLPEDVDQQYRHHMMGYWHAANDTAAWSRAVRYADFHGNPLGVYAQNRRGEAVLYVADGVPPPLLLARFKEACT